MKNITVTVPDHVYRAAMTHAANRGTTVSALVGDYLRSLSMEPGEFARLEAQQKQIQSEITSFRATDRLSRDELHTRPPR